MLTVPFSINPTMYRIPYLIKNKHLFNVGKSENQCLWHKTKQATLCDNTLS